MEPLIKRNPALVNQIFLAIIYGIFLIRFIRTDVDFWHGRISREWCEGVKVFLSATGFFAIISLLNLARYLRKDGDSESAKTEYTNVKKHPLFKEFIKDDMTHKHLDKSDQQIEFVKWLRKRNVSR